MAKRRGNKIDGWLALDKPLGLSSAQAVARVRRLFGAAKVGHGGTLDPLASGVLPIALGEATKTVAWVMDGAKEYRFTIRWGIATATDDAEGDVVATSDVRPSDAALVAVLDRFRGRIEQRPPAFSALKVAGQRAYALARGGAEVELAPRQVEIHDIQFLEGTDDSPILWVRCGKGTYIRSLARDIAQALGTVGHVATLRRTACGPFHETEAVSLDTLIAAAGDAAGNVLSPPVDLGHTSALFGYLRPVVTALDDIPALALTDREAQRLSQGMAVKLPEEGGRPAAPIGTMSPAEGSAGPATDASKGVVRAMAGNRLVAIARIDAGLVRPVRVLNL
ncbi:tRNA pseudouridine(55) synthase TruB [Reyranella sp. CPCC 100927]|uniref:tRNA pseudouridine(55) synthase TruB n=1 Tax=Reyranella sp. CPCC 100927 TaxID=2599616 RepID=UPI0011B3F95D|nr:tRNA pseudouridine(55) synthase TruB [Reyranella sp. CPCC 100927]TWT00228.1 tRNA pseudouridine(55) synthase TruB [Reyranella sp. CPCC 100927]